MSPSSVSRTAPLIVIGLFLGLGGLALLTPRASASEVLQQSVYFGVPRTQVVSGLDFEAACRVSTTYQAIDVLDGATGGSFIAAGPGPCAITVYVLGVPISLPLLNSTPLGRYPFSLPGVAGFTFGLGDVTIDLVTSLLASYSSAVGTLSVSPVDLAWTRWGSSSFTTSSHSGAEGDTLSLAAAFRLSMGFSIGVSVYVLGLRVFSFDLAPIGTFDGTPVVNVPVSVDLKPTHATVTGGWAPSPYSIQANWTPKGDSDFAAYRVRVADSTSSYVFLVDSQNSGFMTVPASPNRTYTVTVTVVDRTGQTSGSNSAVVRTPVLPPPPSTRTPASAGADWTFFVLGIALAFVAGLAVGYVVQRFRRRS